MESTKNQMQWVRPGAGAHSENIIWDQKQMDNQGQTNQRTSIGHREKRKFQIHKKNSERVIRKWRQQNELEPDY